MSDGRGCPAGLPDCLDVVYSVLRNREYDIAQYNLGLMYDNGRGCPAG